MRGVRLNLVLACIVLVSCGLASGNNLGFSFQTGLINGSYLGLDSGQIAMASTVDVGAEVVTSTRDSYTARSSMSLDPESAIIRYLYAGIGRRFYFLSHSSRQPFRSGNSKLEVLPRIQYFFSGEAGVGQAVIKQVTPSLSIQSTSIEYGGGVGIIYPLGNGIGFLGTLGVSKGIGISSVAVDSTVFKAMLGITIK